MSMRASDDDRVPDATTASDQAETWQSEEDDMHPLVLAELVRIRDLERHAEAERARIGRLAESVEGVADADLEPGRPVAAVAFGLIAVLAILVVLANGLDLGPTLALIRLR